MTKKFGVDKAREALRYGKELTGTDGVLTPLKIPGAVYLLPSSSMSALPESRLSLHTAVLSGRSTYPMPKLLLIYDKQCPFCDHYARLARIRDSVGELRLVNAREPGAAMDEVTAAGLDIDQGLVLKMGERLYYGAAAMQVLALLSTRSGGFNRFNYWLFRWQRV